MSALTASALAQWLEGELIGNGSIELDGVSAFADATPRDVVFVVGERYLEAALESAAGCILVPRGVAVSGRTAIAVDNPKLAIASLAEKLYPHPAPAPGVDPRTAIDPTAHIDPTATVGPFVQVAAGARIGRRVILEAGVVIGCGVSIGDDTHLRPRVVVYPGTKIGQRVQVHAGAVLGCDGFGWIRTPEGLHKFPQIGRLEIEDDVEIGANTTIDRGALGATRIGHGSKIDNQVQLAHNVTIGRDCALSAQVGIAGSSSLDDRVTLGGQVGIGDHVRVGEDVMAGGQAGIPSGKQVRPGQVIWGTPARPLSEVKRQLAHLARLERMRDELKELREQIEMLLEDR